MGFRVQGWGAWPWFSDVSTHVAEDARGTCSGRVGILLNHWPPGKQETDPSTQTPKASPECTLNPKPSTLKPRTIRRSSPGSEVRGGLQSRAHAFSRLVFGTFDIFHLWAYKGPHTQIFFRRFRGQTSFVIHHVSICEAAKLEQIAILRRLVKVAIPQGFTCCLQGLGFRVRV